MDTSTSAVHGHGRNISAYGVLRTLLIECDGSEAVCELSQIGKGVELNTAVYGGAPVFSVAASGDVVVQTSTGVRLDEYSEGGEDGVARLGNWPKDGLMATFTMTPFSQGPSAHDARRT